MTQDVRELGEGPKIQRVPVKRANGSCGCHSDLVTEWAYTNGCRTGGSRKNLALSICVLTAAGSSWPLPPWRLMVEAAQGDQLTGTFHPLASAKWDEKEFMV